MPVSAEAVLDEAVSDEDFCAPTPYAKIASPTGDSTTPVQTNQYETEIASFGERTLLKPAWLAADASSAIFRLLKIRAKPRPRMNAPTAISLALNVDALKGRCLKSAFWGAKVVMAAIAVPVFGRTMTRRLSAGLGRSIMPRRAVEGGLLVAGRERRAR